MKKIDHEEYYKLSEELNKSDLNSVGRDVGRTHGMVVQYVLNETVLKLSWTIENGERVFTYHKDITAKIFDELFDEGEVDMTVFFITTEPNELTQTIMRGD